MTSSSVFGNLLEKIYWDLDQVCSAHQEYIEIDDLIKKSLIIIEVSLISL